jgi:KDO2-lipid IV(A) lauroyltransferase
MTAPDLIADALRAVLYGAEPVVAHLPQSTLDPIARAATWLGGEREMRDELAALFGDRPIPPGVVEEARALSVRNELEVLRYRRLDTRTIDRTCVLEGREHLDAALARGRGAIVATGHFGAHQLVMPALGYRGYTMHQLSAPPPVWAELSPGSRLRRRVLRRRWAIEQALPVTHVNVFRFLRPAFTALAKNGVLGLAFDGGGGTEWTQVSFLARRMNVARAPFELWQRSGAALLSAVVVRPLGAARHRVVVEPFEGSTVQDLADRFARWVQRHPSHYLPFVMFRKRVRGTDPVPFFEGWSPAPDALGVAEARERWKRAGAWRG